MTDAVVTPTDPFTLTLIALWEGIVQAHEPLATLVRPGNRIKRYVDPRANKTRANDGDYPELDIVPGGFDEQELYASSDSVLIKQSYEFLFSTGSKDESEMLFPLKWELIRAIFLHAATDDSAGNLLGLNFLSMVDIASQDESREVEDLNRKRRQWTASVTVVASMEFTREQLRAPEPVLV